MTKERFRYYLVYFGGKGKIIFQRLGQWEYEKTREKFEIYKGWMFKNTTLEEVEEALKLLQRDTPMVLIMSSREGKHLEKRYNVKPIERKVRESNE